MGEEEQSNIEQTWAKYWDEGDQRAKDEIISHYLYIVNIVVKRLLPQYRDYSEKDELMSCGVLGLIDAVNKFDRSFGVKFQTYATARVRGEIIDYIRKQDWAPTSLRKKISSIQDAFEVMGSKLDHRPSEKEVADYLGIKVSAVQKALQKAHMFNLVYFESLLYEKETDDFAGPSQDEPYRQVEKEAMTEALKKLVDSLPERERMVITLHYYEGLNMKSIARVLNVTESRVSQIHSRILMEMRSSLKDMYD